MVRTARIHTPIKGVRRPYTEGHWVIFTPSGFPSGFMHMERRHLRKTEAGFVPEETKAFADYWSGSDRTPLDAALAGYTIQLVAEEDLDELLRQHLGGEAEDDKERQHGDQEQVR